MPGLWSGYHSRKGSDDPGAGAKGKGTAESKPQTHGAERKVKGGPSRQTIRGGPSVWLLQRKETPGSAGGSKELTAISLEIKTPFDYNKLAATNCKKNQKEVIIK